MKNKVLKAAIALMLIIVITLADFALVGKSLITYALENIDDSTNHANVKFAAYFKSDRGNSMAEREYPMDSDEIKLYLKVAVKEDGYFDGVITLKDSNFKIKGISPNINVKKIQDNKIYLNTIRSGNNVEIEVLIEPVVEEVYSENMLNKESILSLSGAYKDSTEKDINIQAEKMVALVLVAPTEIETTLESAVITNKTYKVGDVEKRLVQVEIKSSVVENVYPIKSTTFEVALPEGAEIQEVISKGTYATNGKADQKLEYTKTENNTVNIVIKNISINGNISWKKVAKDSIIVTFLLDQDVKIDSKEYSVKSIVELQGKGITKEKDARYNLTKEADGVITTSIENKEEICKGKIYSKEEREFNTKTNIEVNYANLIENAVLDEKNVYVLKSEGDKLPANIEYRTTIISKTEIEKVLGTKGILTIKDGNGALIAQITEEVRNADSNEEIVITYGAGVKELKVETSKAVETGIIRLNHTKVIKAEEYSREQIKQISCLVENAKVNYENQTNIAESRTELKETITAAELTVKTGSSEEPTLSTAVETEITMSVTLKSDSEKYDLYKNPTIKIKLPDYVKTLNVTETVPYHLGNMKISSFKYLASSKEIEIKLAGEQANYNGINDNIYIEIKANVELEETTPNQKDSIILTYTNEKDVTYLNEGKDIKVINIAGHGGLIAFNKISTHNLKTNSVTSTKDEIGNLKMYQNASDANFEINIVNNTGTDLQNVKAIGNLPVEGNVKVGNYTFKNTIAARLKTAINVQSGTANIYYTANANATNDLSNAENGWNANLAQVTNPVLYMIVISNMAKGTSFAANYTMSIPANLQYNNEMKTTYVVNYESNGIVKSANGADITPTAVGLETGSVSVKLEATVGTDKLENNMTVKAGEVIRYKITVENTGSNAAENVKITGLVPEGTVMVRPVAEYEQAGEIYYEEIPNTLFEQNIGKLASSESKVIEYSVRVKNSISNTEAENRITAQYNEDIEITSNLVKCKLERASIRVSVKRVYSIGDLVPTATPRYYVIVENMSNEKIENIKLKFNVSSDLVEVTSISEDEAPLGITNNQWEIDTVNANSYRIFKISTKVLNTNVEHEIVELSAVAIMDNEKYRSNMYVEDLYGINIEMNVSSENAGQYLKVGDIIEYNIEIKNKSKLSEKIKIKLEDNIPEQLSIKKIEVNDVVEGENILSNMIYKTIELEKDSAVKIKIQTIVNYDEGRLENETIVNEVKISCLGEEKTQRIEHILESIVIKEPEDPEFTEDGDDSGMTDEPVIPDVPEEPDGPTNPDNDETNPDNPEPPKEPENSGDSEITDEPEIPDVPAGPDGDEDIENPENPDNPDNPEEPDDTEKPEGPGDEEDDTKTQYTISGKAWVDQDKDGEMNNKDSVLKNIKVKLLNIKTNEFVRDTKKNTDLIIETTEEGKYIFENIEKGKYVVVFEYDKTLYKPTIYQKENIQEDKNSNVISKVLTINGVEKEYAVTNEIELNKNISDIDMGLVFVKQFDIKVEKYISKVIVQDSKETKTYNYTNEDFAKVELNAKRMTGSTILVQYTIKVTNIGDVDAHINSIVDYIPVGLKFSSELNKDWYEVGTELYTNSLSKEPIARGGSREINLVLTKTKTDGNAELIKNIAEIYDAYNIYGIEDMNSEQANKNVDENDLASADLMISIQTGTVFNYIILVVSMLAVIGAAAYCINKKILEKEI